MISVLNPILLATVDEIWVWIKIYDTTVWDGCTCRGIRRSLIATRFLIPPCLDFDQACWVVSGALVCRKGFPNRKGRAADGSCKVCCALPARPSLGECAEGLRVAQSLSLPGEGWISQVPGPGCPVAWHLSQHNFCRQCRVWLGCVPCLSFGLLGKAFWG